MAETAEDRRANTVSVQHALSNGIVISRIVALAIAAEFSAFFSFAADLSDAHADARLRSSDSADCFRQP